MRPQQLPIPLDRLLTQRSNLSQHRLTSPSSLGPITKMPTKPKLLLPPNEPNSAPQNELRSRKLLAKLRSRRLFRRLLKSAPTAKSTMVLHLQSPMSPTTWIAASVISRRNLIRQFSVWRAPSLRSEDGVSAGFLED